MTSFPALRDKTFTTLLGDIRVVVRPSDRRTHCHSGSCPGAAALGWTGRRLSWGAEPVVALGGTLTSFAEATTKILPQTTGIRLSESTVERTTEVAGRPASPGFSRDHRVLQAAADSRDGC